MIVSGTILSAATAIAQALTGNVTLAGNAHAVCSVIAAPTSVKQKQVTTPPNAVATLTVPVARAVTSESVVLSVAPMTTAKASNLVALVKTMSVSPITPVTIIITTILTPAKQTVTVKMESSASLASAKNPHVKPTQSALVVKSAAAASVVKVVPLITTVATVKSATPVDAKLESVAMTQTVQRVQSVA